MRVADLNLADTDQLQLKGIEIAGYHEGDVLHMTFTVVQVEQGSASLRGMLNIAKVPPPASDPAPIEETVPPPVITKTTHKK